MPVLNDSSLESRKLPLGNFQYKAARIEDLEASEFTLVVVLVDTSGSVAGFKKDLENCLKEIIQGCSRSPYSDNLLVMVVQFDNNVVETHGFKPLNSCNIDDYDDVLTIGGMTALHDAWMFGLSALSDYASHLDNADYSVNGLVVGLTDGMDNVSNFGTSDVKNMISKINKQESLSSLLSILIGLNHDSDASYRQQVTDCLNNFKNETGITQYAEVKDTTEKTFAKLADFISRSVSSQSQSLATGGASQPQPLTI